MELYSACSNVLVRLTMMRAIIVPIFMNSAAAHTTIAKEQFELYTLVFFFFRSHCGLVLSVRLHSPSTRVFLETLLSSHLCVATQK